MPAPVVVEFTVAGIGKVNQAFMGIERASLQHAKRVATIEDRAQREKERALQKLAKETERWQRDEVKSAEKAQAAELKATQTAEREKQREVEKTARYMQQVRERSVNYATRLAVKEAEAEIREIKRVQKARTDFRRAIGGAAFSAGGRSVNQITGGAIGMVTGSLALGGGFAIADTVHHRLAAEKSAAQLVNAVTAGGTPPKGASVSEILSRASASSITTGMTKEDLVGGALSYARKAKGGDFEGAMKNMEFFGKMAKTTGADINDIAEAAGTLQSQNPNLKAPQMQQMLLDVYAQGKQGSMSMVDVAKQVGVLASTRNSYQGDSAANQRKLLALGQLAAPQGSVEEAGTFIKDLTLEAGKHAKDLKAMGVKFDKQGRMESPEQMIDAVFKSTKGDQTKIEKLFGARGTQLFGALGQSFNAAGGGDAGITAINKQMASVTEASMSSADLEKQFQQVMSTNSEKMSVAMEKIENELEGKLVPYMDKFADKMGDPEFLSNVTKLIDGMGTVADFFVKNPFEGIGAIVVAKVGADVTKAAIGETIKKLIAASFSGGGGGVTNVATSAAGGATSTAGKGVGGKLAAAGAIAAIAVASEQVGESAIDSMAHQKIMGRAKVQDLVGQVRSGKISPEQAQKIMDQAKADSMGLSGSIAGSQLTGMGALIGSVTGNRDNFASRAAGRQSEASQIANSNELAAAIKEMTAALKNQPIHKPSSPNDPSRTVSMAQRSVQ